MKCPHCDQEHPDNFQFCPITGQRISSMQACRNEDCKIFGQYILPPEARYCPKCGRPLIQESNDQHAENNEVQYTLNDDLVLILQMFYPVCGIVLGETTFEDAKSIERDVNMGKSYFYHNFSEKFEKFDIRTDDKTIFTDFGFFDYNETKQVYDRHVVQSFDEIPEQWIDLGFSWEMKPDDVVDFFERIEGFDEASIYRYESGDCDVDVYTLDDKLGFNLGFEDDKLCIITINVH